ncbi:terminase large subunit domain-containing protein [Bartonella sp. DGB1]|uniref:terminase large subunit domain-containing protein n=1 Tax=Bartonella sp. DGB1 TaxID=3239807 RepID=UPI003525BB33
MKDSAGEWFRDIVRAIFGSWDSKNKVRMINHIFCLVPKKNSKTTGGAAIMLVNLILNERPNAEMLIVAPTLDIAKISFEQLCGMIEIDTYLSNLFHITYHKREIKNLQTGAVLRVKSFDVKTLTGVKPVAVLIDELHVIASLPQAERVITQLRGGMASVAEGFILTITTQSDQAPKGVFKEQLQVARKIRDGEIRDTRTLPILYEFPQEVQSGDDEQWRDVNLWKYVTPNLGLSVNLDFLKEAFNEADRAGEASLNRFLSQHLNVQIATDLTGEVWGAAPYWKDCIDYSLASVENLLAKSDKVTIGIDGGGLDDLLGLCVLGLNSSTGKYYSYFHALADRIILERRKDIAVQLTDFEREGSLSFYNKSGEETSFIVNLVKQVNASGKLPAIAGIGVDSAGISSVLLELQNAGFTITQNGIAGAVTAVPQGYKLSGTIQEIEKLIKDKNLFHSGSLLMEWVIGNAKLEQRGSAVYITKKISGRAKIDPLIGLFNAHHILMSQLMDVRSNSVDSYFSDFIGD